MVVILTASPRDGDCFYMAHVHTVRQAMANQLPTADRKKSGRGIICVSGPVRKQNRSCKKAVKNAGPAPAHLALSPSCHICFPIARGWAQDMPAHFVRAKYLNTV